MHLSLFCNNHHLHHYHHHHHHHHHHHLSDYHHELVGFNGDVLQYGFPDLSHFGEYNIIILNNNPHLSSFVIMQMILSTFLFIIFYVEYVNGL